MKKVLVICLMVVMVMSLSATAFATPGFVSSPSGQPGPDVEEFEPKDEDCTAELVVTPYGDKEELPEVLQDLIDQAYDEIKETDNLADLNDAFAKMVEEKGIDSKRLAVSDLFDLHVTDCDFHDGHTEFDIVLSLDMLEHFVGLLHLNKDGVWEWVEDAQVEGDHLKFSVESFSPFAVVVETEEEPTPPQAGDNSNIHIYGIVMAVAALAILLLAVKGRKQMD